jgi:coenzyme PQQ synthesis protein D (PqqD)
VTADRPSVVDGLDVNEVKDGLIVYDTDGDRVHYLNATAAVVFALCDGTNDDASIADLVAKAFELGEPPRTEVDECLAQLRDEGLVR